MNSKDFYFLAGAPDLFFELDIPEYRECKENVSHQQFDVKTHQKGLSSILHKEIARGAVKIIWAKQKLNASHSTDFNHVYYTAISSALARKENELKEEVKKMQLIAVEISNNKGKANHLAVEIIEVSPEEQIQGQYTVKVERASGDFEKKLLKPETTMQERISLGRDLLDGLANLHAVNYVHGDIKPENCLIYEKEEESILKISDFGKTEKIERGANIYKGNMRFAPPEGTLNKKGDVYGAALVLIRNFEEQYLQKENIKSLKTISKENVDTAASDNFRGVEKYVIEHKNCRSACNEGMALDVLKRRATMAISFDKDKKAHSTAIHEYIDELHEKLKNSQDFTKNQAKEFCSLLKKMTVGNPEERISSAMALAQYENIFFND